MNIFESKDTMLPDAAGPSDYGISVAPAATRSIFPSSLSISIFNLLPNNRPVSGHPPLPARSLA